MQNYMLGDRHYIHLFSVWWEGYKAFDRDHSTYYNLNNISEKGRGVKIMGFDLFVDYSLNLFISIPATRFLHINSLRRTFGKKQLKNTYPK